MKYYELVLNKGFESIVINENGEVVSRLGTVQGDMHNMSGKWKVTGLWCKKPFGHVGFIPFSVLIDRHDSLDYMFKNGKCRYGFTDNDHGTERMNGEIKNIKEVEWIENEYRIGWFTKLNVA